MLKRFASHKYFLVNSFNVFYTDTCLLHMSRFVLNLHIKCKTHFFVLYLYQIYGAQRKSFLIELDSNFAILIVRKEENKVIVAV